MLHIHPKYLSDSQLLMLWCDGLKGQQRISAKQSWKDFILADNPLHAIGAYLSFIASEGLGRGYRMNHELIIKPNFDEKFLPITITELESERKQLDLPQIKDIQSNPIYCVIY